MRITLDDGPFCTFLIRAEDGQSRLIQFDADFPGVARTFGWSGGDDLAPNGIWDAYAFLDDQVGAIADDPGYFET